MLCPKAAYQVSIDWLLSFGDLLSMAPSPALCLKLSVPLADCCPEERASHKGEWLLGCVN
jgi:hypothetical protein